MITHVVMFKLKDPQLIDEAVERILALEGKIPSLRRMEAGKDLIRAERSYDLALIARFDDLDGLQAYQEHPEHIPALEYMRSITSAVAAVDFES